MKSDASKAAKRARKRAATIEIKRLNALGRLTSPMGKLDGSPARAINTAAAYGTTGGRSKRDG